MTISSPLDYHLKIENWTTEWAKEEKLIKYEPIGFELKGLPTMASVVGTRFHNLSWMMEYILWYYHISLQSHFPWESLWIFVFSHQTIINSNVSSLPNNHSIFCMNCNNLVYSWFDISLCNSLQLGRRFDTYPDTLFYPFLFPLSANWFQCL